jgi:hypothetical protein
MKNFLTIAFICVILTGCTALDLLSSAIPDGGTDVNANAQIGQNNTQQVVANQESTEITAESVIQQEIENIPPWVMVLLIAGWLLPTPTTMFNFIAKLFKRKNYVRQHEKNDGQEKEVNNQKENRCAGD